MNKAFGFGLAAIMSTTALASSGVDATSSELNALDSNGATVQLTLSLTNVQAARLAEIIDALQIEIRDWKSIEASAVPTRTCVLMAPGGVTSR